VAARGPFALLLALRASLERGKNGGTRIARIDDIVDAEMRRSM
jgi:hypothetical protein